ncbi:MAG TPA: amidohydrolase [Candidatus Atribacteria bacterium]|uniref:Amidohydrolase n=1 Tax=candidate division TA06 bacterium 34_109 TaxID=1635277 RepID=A0A117M614_UNCT6|nr:MAG: Amidohydrolase [candidate division TA06 bacterium 34_109]HBY57681.1 amidohydrolase [Candidatus Atribacteria bacterium]
MAKVIKGAYLLLEDGLKEEWGVRVEGNKIAEVAPNEKLKVETGDEVFDFTHKLIAPGFINGHMHMYGVLSHGISVETFVHDFSSFLEDFWWPYIENRLNHQLIEITTRWACVEMIKSGITTFMDVLEAPNAIPNALEVEAEAVNQAGLRGILSFEACERMGKENGQLGLKENRDFIRKYNQSDNLVQGMMSVHTLFTADKEYLIQAKKMADELGCDIHMHLSESVYEPNWSIEKYGKRPVEVYNELNFLGPNVVASQGVQLEPKEIDILAEKGARLVHMPLSNCEVGGGIAPVPALLAKGIKVGLGTDGYLNNYFEVMRGAFLIHKAYQQNPAIMPAKDVYKMATNEGAKAIGRDNLGCIKVGYFADLIAVKVDTPTPLNSKNIYDQLILFRNPTDVTEVMINGKFILRDGELLTINEEKTRIELRAAVEKFWKLD